MNNYYSWLNQNAETIFKWTAFFALIYFPLFADLDILPLRLWDESRLAESAYEMNKYGHYLIPHINGNPDMWSVKPPLMIWLQVLGMKMFGVGELAVRLPSAIAGGLTCLLLMGFCLRYLKSFWWGFAASMVLVTSQGYMWMHAERSGDYDALLTFFTTLYSLSFYAYSVEKKSKFILLTGIGIILAALTKGIAGILFLPALFVFALIKKMIPSLLKNKLFYLNVLLFGVIVGGYYLLREHYNPGYIHRVAEDEWGGRYLDVIQNHTGSFWFYHENFLSSRFSYWYLLFPFGIIIGRASKNALVKDFVLYLTLLLVFFFIIISSSKTKATQYDLPMYPLMALTIGVLLPFLLDIIAKFQNFASLSSPYFKYAIILLVFQAPYRSVIYDTYKPYEKPNDVELYIGEAYLQDAIKENKNVNNFYVHVNGPNMPYIFYANILKDKGQTIYLTDSLNFNKGDKVIVSQKLAQDLLLKKYNCSAIDSLESLRVYEIQGNLTKPGQQDSLAYAITK